ncbi:hypothetical protein [Sporisorium scitamineum]|uniref:RanBP2-type domain-containing protein n=1 Tax=Sporisorium scitamineum TaxID=49012 RepID=A0A0F7S3Z8_9BASI|nr:hypothetical protein [Sporisorium scitamineum]
MTGLPPAGSLDDATTMPVFAKNDVVGGQSHQSTALRASFSDCDGTMSSLSSSFNGLTMFEQQGRDTNKSIDAASLRMNSTLTDPTQTAAPLLIPMQPTGAGVPLVSVVETLSSKGSKAAADDPETVAAAYKLKEWGIGFGPGYNPKVMSGRNGTHGRGRSTGNEPPIVNTGNSGPMCAQPGDWICTVCAFMNWRRRERCMRCFPHADGNEFSRGIQSGERLAKRLASGLDTNTEEYRRSVQALCQDKAKRGFNTYMPRAAVHELPRNPLHASGSGGSPQMHGLATISQTDDCNVLGIHMSSNLQQHWRHNMDRPAGLPDYFSAGHDQYQQHTVLDQRQSQRPAPMQQQQQYFGNDTNQACSPYKAYSPQLTGMTKPSTMSGSVDYECSGLLQQSSDSSVHSAQFRTDALGRMSLFRSRTHTGAPELFQQQTAPAQGVTLTTGRSLSQHTPQEASSGLPRDIWAPAPKRPTLIPVDPEDVSKEKRAKPQPIGTRSSGGSGGSAAGGSTINGGNYNTSELDGRKDDKHTSMNNSIVNNNIDKISSNKLND